MKIPFVDLHKQYLSIKTEIDSQKQRIELLERNNLDQEKKDMWDD